MYLTDATYTIRDWLLSTSLWNTIRSNLCNFSLFSTDEETFANALMCKNLLLRTCSTQLWEGERGGRKVPVWGGKG